MKYQDCASCGQRKAMVRFEKETMTVEYANSSVIEDDLSGWRCSACGEIEFDPESAARYAAAGDKLVLRARENAQREIRRIRRKLRLSQAKAAELTGGGHDTFSRYERGDIIPMPAVINLFKLLDRHPGLLKEIS